jgi:UDP-N-acetyl-D-galactosamine dehydrogenase
VPDIRNSKVVDIYTELTSFGLKPLVHDPMADPHAVTEEYSVQLSSMDEFRDLHALILAVPHLPYGELDANGFGRMLGINGIFVDVKSSVAPELLREDICYWSL